MRRFCLHLKSLLSIFQPWGILLIIGNVAFPSIAQEDTLLPVHNIVTLQDNSADSLPTSPIIIVDSLKEKAYIQTIDSLRRAWDQERQEHEVEINQLHQQIELCQNDINKKQDSILYCEHRIRSIEDSLVGLKMSIAREQEQVSFLKVDSVEGRQRYEKLSTQYRFLQTLNDTLRLQNISIQRQLNEKNVMLERQIAILKEKEEIFAEKELLYKEAINTSDVDKAKLAGNVELKNESLRGKEKEISYLQKSINERDSALLTRDRYVEELISEKNKYYNLSDTLQKQLTEAEKKLLKINEELKYTQKRAKEAEEKIAMSTHRKKKVRVIQGLAMKLYRTPDWDMMPISQSGTYVNSIVNRNAGWAEFDFVTGASVMLIDLSSDSSRFSSDLGIYVGFGGSNLFKNFYVGANYKFLDFFHVCVGINVAEYKVLAAGYEEGDILPVGIAIQTVNEWKIKPFISFSVDLEFLSYMGKR